MQTLDSWPIADRRAIKDAQHMRGRIVGEEDLGIVDRNRKADVRTACRPASAVVFAPALVDRDLGLVVARWQQRGREHVGAIAI